MEAKLWWSCFQIYRKLLEVKQVVCRKNYNKGPTQIHGHSYYVYIAISHTKQLYMELEDRDLSH